jgi:exodeoxyribonuclease VII large subunit
MRTIQGRIDFEIAKIEQMMDRPSMRDPLNMVTTRLEVITNLRARSFRSTDAALAIASEEVAGLRMQVRTLSPQATLDRGYAVLQKEDGNVVRSASELTPGDRLRVRLAKGEAKVVSE